MNNISDLKFDDKNFNDHTEHGMSLLEKSLRENGAGRSILIDKDNNIIAGNGIIEAETNRIKTEQLTDAVLMEKLIDAIKNGNGTYVIDTSNLSISVK